MRKEIEIWLKQAEEDLDTAEYNFEGKKYYAAAFFCQQAVEKALKALYMKRFNTITPPSTHSLVFLAKEIKIPRKFISFLKELTPHYTLSRYPGITEEEPIELYDKEIVENLIRNAKEIITWVKKQIK